LRPRRAQAAVTHGGQQRDDVLQALVAGLLRQPHGRAGQVEHDTDNGLVFRVEADTAEQAASQVIGIVGDVGVIGAIYLADDILAAGQPVAAIDGALDPRLPPLLTFGLPDEPPNDDGGAWDWDQP
jgi:hypothetical protein